MTDKELEEIAFVTLKKWYSLICARKRKQAREQAKLVINMCKSIIKDLKQDVDCNKALIFGILFRGLQDFTDLSETTELSTWKAEHKLIEKAWGQMLDCKERIEYVSNFCHEETLDWVLNKIKCLEKTFLNAFGPGLYSSPEIIAKREICNVCKKDFRSCEHILGNIYDGIRCVTIPQDIQFRSVAIVQVPEDPRCRIWPWQLREDKVIETCIVTTFRLDDFMDESDQE